MKHTMSDFLQLLQGLKELLTIPAICGLVVFVVSEIIIIKLQVRHKPRNKKVEKAIHRGNIVKAKRLSMWDEGITAGERITSHYHATYSYEVDGASYEYRYLSRTYPPLEITLYYINNPRHAYSRIETDKRNGFFTPFIIFLPFLLAGIVIYLLGGVS